ncbi:hypothetical protein FB451DRAFT_1403481 [Mycena latifolia]|nr:hypothetical protein FB451DRAFT_1403481 [Mycena latifolia]
MSRSLASLYRVAWVLSLVQMASGLATILILKAEEARYAQMFAVLYPLITFSHTTQQDAVSRLDRQFFMVIFLLFLWVLFVGLAPGFGDTGLAETMSNCVSTRFMNTKCAVLGLDVALPFAFILTLGTISWTIYRGARGAAGQDVQTAPRESHSGAKVKK